MQALAEQYIGTPIPQGELAEAWEAAARKLEWIVSLYGDDDGSRKEPWYLAQLIAEAVEASRLRAHLSRQWR